jgi:hypothetical protein
MALFWMDEKPADRDPLWPVSRGVGLMLLTLASIFALTALVVALR